MIDIKNSMKFIDKSVNSQGGEGVVLEKITQELNILKGHIVDIGSWDGIRHSNVRNLLIKGWHGLLIEGDTGKVENSIYHYKGYDNINHHNSFVDLDNNNINNILKKFNYPNDFDILNLDIDSFDFWVWKSLISKPKIVCIEHNGNIIKDDKTIPYSKDWKYSHEYDNYGASAKALFRLGIAKGYDLISASKWNLIFLDNKYSQNFEKFERIDSDWFIQELGVNPNRRKKRGKECFVFNPE